MSSNKGEFIAVLGWLIMFVGNTNKLEGAGLNYHFAGLAALKVWPKDKLGFSMDRDAGFFFQEKARLSNLF